mmetsp:Transcript_111002/g.173624  ORF Transcript_111002/g.173624 Transcript_111002/m.173624 type:complete len:105 (-) Transcript_111002:59-373(-)
MTSSRSTANCRKWIRSSLARLKGSPRKKEAIGLRKVPLAKSLILKFQDKHTCKASKLVATRQCAKRRVPLPAGKPMSKFAKCVMQQAARMGEWPAARQMVKKQL